MTGKEKIKKTIKNYLFQEREIMAVLLLGSANKEEMTEDSDIDIAIIVYPGKKLDMNKKMLIIKELSYKLGRIIDVGEITSKNLIYSNEAVIKGREIFIKDKEAFEMKRAALLGMYLQFNYERREVINAYSA